jgi:hypothetical protein
MSDATYYSSRGGVFLGRQAADIEPFAATLAPRRRMRAYSSNGAVLVSAAPLPQTTTFNVAWARGANTVIQGPMS